MRILLAEDEELAVSVMRRLLGDIASQIDCAKSLEEVRAMASVGQYDIVIFDLRLHGSGHEEGISSIREIKHIANASLIVVSGVMHPGLKERCIAAGADFFIHKIEAENGGATALKAAVYAAIIHHPRMDSKDPEYLKHVLALERLVGKGS